MRKKVMARKFKILIVKNKVAFLISSAILESRIKRLKKLKYDEVDKVVFK